MEKEQPKPNPPLSAKEAAVVSALTDADLRKIDETILKACERRWLKVATVVLRTESLLREQFPGLSYVFYTERLFQLAEKGRLESAGDIRCMRFSEVRLP